jgi:hypothetical protein
MATQYIHQTIDGTVVPIPVRTRLVPAEDLYADDRIWWEGATEPVVVRRVTHHYGLVTVDYGGGVVTLRWDDLVARVMTREEERDEQEGDWWW